jgi:cytochrome c nitrite reductase small subunit
MTTEPSVPRTKAASKLTIALAVVISLALGAAAGTGGYTFVYAKGASYFRDDPASCANCHIMQDHLDAYFKSTHRAVATCNDCHTPPGLIPKYFTKAEHGFFHSLAFTTDQFHEPIQMKARSRRVTETACRKCHQDIVHAIDIESLNGLQEKMSCTRCHPNVGHPN